eukprot:TRINITY_DN16398_c0_g1_i1.p1 TRINITY_DN16398_c0_g1~~TRINITY_DN16398_c0_g1_i1.p1  ORF type:complete len:272 (+),score=44.05 TRINITY_DN16398_c0_g1_i1:59-874(+)
MFSSRAVRGAKYCVAGGCGLSAIAACQALHLRLSYVPLQDPSGPREGCAGFGLPGKTLHLLFIGDSICVGVGASTAAPLQAACAKRLSSITGQPVAWTTIAASGADVRELSSMFRREEGGSKMRRFDVAVVMCGVNDGKKLLEGRWPEDFRRDLAALVNSVRREVPGISISVPCIPGYLAAPGMQLWPMRHLVRTFFHTFEAQKEAVAETEAVSCPSPPMENFPMFTDTAMWASDGIHPSSEGYRICGEWLGANLASTCSEAFVTTGCGVE